MYKIILREEMRKYGCEDLVKIFLRPDLFRTFYVSCVVGDGFLPEAGEKDGKKPGEELPAYEAVLNFSAENKGDKNEVKRALYNRLSGLTGRTHEWGILTGVKPVKLAGELLRRTGSYEAAYREFTEKYLLSPEKAALILDICRYQKRELPDPPENGVGVYIGIPFCPTRCLYCSFTSNQVSDGEIARYLSALHREIDGVSAAMKRARLYPESIYVGGGTPTTLSAPQLDELLAHAREAFDLSGLREFTVEAGRPDTIDREKLTVLHRRGVGRISINPQTMKDETLRLIGRSHTAADIERAFTDAREAGFSCINADIIAGLQGEDEADFRRTLEKLFVLGAENITVHTLAVKRASRLIEADRDFHYKQAGAVAKQLAAGRALLAEHGYVPYYLYRQKNMAGGLENTGYCKDGTISVYNVRIMEEKQTIVALGAGAMSKVFFPKENRLERVENVTNYEQYIDRVEEMIARKEKNLFGEEETIC